MSHAEAMDRMYRLTRHVYDFTRKYYLFGRDQLLDQMTIRPGDTVLEMGCGTARNLIKLAKRYPTTNFYGLDASSEMLETAQAKIDAAGLQGKIELRQCLAEELDHQKTFHLSEPFDLIFFSYSLSMIPPWAAAIDSALKNLKAEHSFYVVDFWDQKGFPKWFQSLLQGWLHLFHVHYRPEFLDYFSQLEKEKRGSFTVTEVMRRYAFIAVFLKS